MALAYSCFGKPEHTPLILVAGTAAPAQFWPESFCQSLAASGFYVIRYSHRDTGNSTFFSKPYSLQTLVLDLRDLLQHLDIKTAHLVGHSLGGYIVQSFTFQFPQRVCSLTAISSGCTVHSSQAKTLGIPDIDQGEWRKLTKHKPTGDYHSDINSWLEYWGLLNGDWPVDPTMAMEYLKYLYDKKGKRKSDSAFNHLFAYMTIPESHQENIQRIRKPCLIMHGDKDTLLPKEQGMVTSRLIPSAKLHLLAGAGHMFFHMEIWREIQTNLHDFLRQI